jgi:hypothetical protein
VNTRVRVTLTFEEAGAVADAVRLALMTHGENPRLSSALEALTVASEDCWQLEQIMSAIEGQP